MHWTERRTAIVNLAHELRDRGWHLFGYHADQSEARIDYYHPASWDGIATHPAHPAIVIGVDVSSYTCKMSGQDGWPTFHPTPKGRTWHIEYQGQIYKTGVGLSKCASHNPQYNQASQIVNRMERLIQAAEHHPPSTTSPPDINFTYKIETDRDWKWITFSTKPPRLIRAALKSHLGARWSRRRHAWYIRTDPPSDEGIKNTIEAARHTYHEIRATHTEPEAITQAEDKYNDQLLKSPPLTASRETALKALTTHRDALLPPTTAPLETTITDLWTQITTLLTQPHPATADIVQLLAPVPTQYYTALLARALNHQYTYLEDILLPATIILALHQLGYLTTSKKDALLDHQITQALAHPRAPATSTQVTNLDKLLEVTTPPPAQAEPRAEKNPSPPAAPDTITPETEPPPPKPSPAEMTPTQLIDAHTIRVIQIDDHLRPATDAEQQKLAQLAQQAYSTGDYSIPREQFIEKLTTATLLHNPPALNTSISTIVWPGEVTIYLVNITHAPHPDIKPTDLPEFTPHHPDATAHYRTAGEAPSFPTPEPPPKSSPPPHKKRQTPIPPRVLCLPQPTPPLLLPPPPSKPPPKSLTINTAPITQTFGHAVAQTRMF